MARKTTNTTTIRTYSEMLRYSTFEKRFDYLKLDGSVAEETFGVHRWLNQYFYKTLEWKKTRDIVLIRDKGCDLGVEGFDIFDKVIVHHINPITKQDILDRSIYLLDPEFLICTSKRTHDMLHYGNPGDKVYSQVVERTPFDTCPWRRKE